ncbi:MAG TPA: glycoside hydrolase family 3 N-terminal domain-containing protein [Bacteroidales bacterium]|jgi:beta-glucosidase-like glycosyl hydrolase/CubicO group peptidase (beta-lactamase class C family)|nr:glycoside hydrolase family 3 N-terminal domain-containing protein [Bacteroidales bacterium]
MDKYFLKSVLIVGLLIIMILFTRFIPSGELEEKSLRLTDIKADPEFLQSPESWIDSVLDTLTIEERIAQLIMVAAYSNDNQSNEKEITELIREQKIGGLVFFQGAPHKQAELTNLYQSFSKIPLLIGMDAENGLAMRLDSTIRYPSQMMLGAVEDDRLIFDMGVQIARQLKRLGVHVNFAPVVDVNNNPSNPVINRRSFGEDLIAVSRKSLFYMIGLENGGIISVAKHFPGHGDTDSDSHKELPVLNHTRERLDSIELFPFRELIYNGLSGIMTAHLNIPALDPRDDIPSSLSYLVIDTLLRKEMGFKGLVFTDALSMKGITNHFKPVEAAEMALLAGNDVLLMPEDISEVIKDLSRKVKNGKIPKELIDQKCRRILAAKYWAGLHTYRPVVLEGLAADLNKPEYVLLQQKLSELALTLLENKKDILPLKRLDTLRVASIVFSDVRDTAFQQMLNLYMPVKFFYIKGDGNDKTDSIFRALKKYNLLIISVHANSVSPVYQYGINDVIIQLADSLSHDKSVILDVFATPYILPRFRKLDRVKALIVSYENSDIVQKLSAQAIFGATGLSGLLPVSSLNWEARKSGLKTETSGRLKFSIPLEGNMSADSLRKIDEIVNRAIEYQAIPGCQVLVARKGMVILHKTYGHLDYTKSHPVKPDDLYDLASVTKVAATTQAIMHLVDEECVGVNQKLSAYLPYLEKTNKKDLYVADVLLHQSGLQPFIQFYFSTIEPVFRNNLLITSTISDANPIRIGPGQYLSRYTQFKSTIISPVWSKSFPLQVAENMYIMNSWPDSMYMGIANSTLREKKEYVYSDLGFILFRQMIDTVARVPFERLVDSLFYRRLGAGTLGFNPLTRFDRTCIAPTEDDQLFRHQLLRGYVHDQRAAMFGGISGHAGLFGNAIDLAKLFQMNLNKGQYGGERYLSEETLDLFTRERHGIEGSRRGFGFDKPEPDITKPGPSCLGASSESYGHTGFTGTMVWVDPKYDLVYIFLSNRVCPDALNTKLIEMNVRTDVQQVIYNAIIDK